ncbi:MAG: outer membrane protein assembly factor BamE [Pseudomonadota bacterium]|nr:outer membrane protein assembly factor BamE [Pseudomonadota bacterium]
MPVRKLPIALALTLAAALTACIYQPPIQQGNALEPELVAQLKPGMTRDQVRYLLGTPMARNDFSDRQWDYIYYIDRGDAAEKRTLTLYFEGDRLVNMERDVATIGG